MMNYSLTQRFLLLALNGQEASDAHSIPSLLSRSVVASQLLHLVAEQNSLGEICPSCDIQLDTLGGDELLTVIMQQNSNSCITISNLVNQVNKLPQKLCDEIATKSVNDMIDSQKLEVIPSLWECDINTMNSARQRQYRCVEIYLSQEKESFRIEALYNPITSIDVIFMIWLLYQIEEIGFLFSSAELEVLEVNITAFCTQNALGESLFLTRLSKGLTSAKAQSLFNKNNNTNRQFDIDFIHKTRKVHKEKSIFIESRAMFSGTIDRVNDVKDRLEEKGHTFAIRSLDAVSLVEIDNTLYDLVPDAIRVRIINVHGVRLMRHVE